ncbi:putative ATPase [Aurantimicrobium minutum]|nr:putative ATPase [Aurantimicrobium minutum]
MSSVDSPPWYVISGGPSSGKSTTIGLLRERGYHVTDEQARAIIEEEMAKGRPLEEIRGDAHEFQQEILKRQLATESSLDPNEIVFLDRGIPDGLAYAHFLQIEEDAEIHAASERARYRRVFILDLLTLHDDGSRIEDTHTQEQIQDFLVATYEAMSFDVVRVPVLSAEERVAFILERL